VQFVGAAQATPPFDGFAHEHRHPITLILMLAWSGWVSSVLSGDSPYLPWLLCWLSVLLIAFGITQALVRSRCVSVFAAWAVGSLPLLTNQAMEGGYAEVWLAGVFLASAGLITVGVAKGRRQTTFFGLAIAFLLLAIKNIGVVFLAIIFAAMGTLMLFRVSKILALVTIALGTILCSSLVSHGFDLSGWGIDVFWNPETSRVRFAGWTDTLVYNPILLVAKNQLFAFLVNSSFSLALVVTMATLLALATSPFTQELLKLTLVGLTVLTLGTAFFVSAQLFTWYGTNYAMPGSDTGNSRLMLPLMTYQLVWSFCLLGGLLERSGAHEEQDLQRG
jgi:hypothetical protein